MRKNCWESGDIGFRKISIITACFNSELTIERTVKSVIQQNYPNIEYIIIDGASTDQTLKIIQKYKKYISKIVSEPDQGVYDAFNKGISYASGEVIYFLNSDDYLFTNSIIKDVLKYFYEDVNLKFFYANVLVKDEFANIENINGKSFCLNDFKKGQMLPHPSVFVKKEVFEEIGLFNMKYKIASDLDFVIRCFKKYNDSEIQYCNKIISVFNYGGISTNPKYQKNLEQEKKDILFQQFQIEYKDNLDQLNSLYKLWLDTLLMKDRGVSSVLKEEGLVNISIFGTLRNGIYLLKDMRKESLNVISFIDNNYNIQGETIEGIKINSTEWLLGNQKKIDVIIVSIENDTDVDIIEDLKSKLENRVVVYSWKDLIKKLTIR